MLRGHFIFCQNIISLGWTVLLDLMRKQIAAGKKAVKNQSDCARADDRFNSPGQIELYNDTTILGEYIPVSCNSDFQEYEKDSSIVPLCWNLNLV